MDIYRLAEIYYLLGSYLQSANTIRNLAYSSLWAKLLHSQASVHEIYKIKSENWIGALEVLGENEEFHSQKSLDVRLSNSNGRAVKVESSLYFCRGVALFNLGSKESARNSFFQSLKVDVRCFQALDMLLTNFSISSEEQILLLENIINQRLPALESRLIKCLYTLKVDKVIIFNKISNIDKMLGTHQSLESNFRLSSSPLIAHSKASFHLSRRNILLAHDILAQYENFIQNS